MTKMGECLIHVDLANALREHVDKMSLKPAERFSGLSCPECQKWVKPMKA
jgi:hypothetical protein